MKSAIPSLPYPPLRLAAAEAGGGGTALAHLREVRDGGGSSSVRAMVRVLLPLLALPLLAACTTLPKPTSQATYTNPILSADYSDPDVIRAGNRYYLVASSFHFSPGIPVLESDDLVHWKLIAHVLPKLTFAPQYDMVPPFQLDDTKSKPTTGTRYAGGVWAPSIRQHNGLFYVYWPTPDEGVFMATAKTPQGPWSAPTQVLKGPGYEDPCPFWDDDGTAWLIHGKVGAGPLILHHMTPDGTRVLDDGIVVAEDKTNLPVLEGPKLYKRNGWFYIFAPIGGVGTGPQAVGRARAITGPYEWRHILEPGNGLDGPHQGGYVETPSGQGWFIHFNATGAFGRIDYLEPVTWTDDWPMAGEGGQPVLTHAMPDTGVTNSTYRLEDSDDFNAPTLGLQWSWNHNPDDTRWSLTEHPGSLRLHAGPAQSLTTARNTLTQILIGPHMQATGRLNVAHMTDGQRAGLTLFGVKTVWIGIVRDHGQSHIATASAGVETLGPPLTTSTIDLRADVTADQTVRFSYSTDGNTFTPFGDAQPLSKFSWWKGSRPGLFTYIKAEPGTPVTDGYIDIDSYTVTHLP